MSNAIWIKQKEREARDALLDFIEDKINDNYFEQLIKYLDTYRKRAFDAGVFDEQQRTNLKRN